jgi:hypothetical protein
MHGGGGCVGCRSVSLAATYRRRGALETKSVACGEIESSRAGRCALLSGAGRADTDATRTFQDLDPRAESGER